MTSGRLAARRCRVSPAECGRAGYCGRQGSWRIPNGHGASVGAFIYLVQAEILAAAAILAGRETEPGLHQCDDETRRFIAAAWLQIFDGASS